MPRKSDKIPINNSKFDRRVKLTPKQRQAIKRNKGGLSQRKLAKEFGVSRRLIQFIQDPSKAKDNKLRRAERGGSKRYYDKEKNTSSVREHRQYKSKLYKDGKIR
ncbi:MAG: hypothetical protein ABFS35_21535 [Bacteroidota bacterium]